MAISDKLTYLNTTKSLIRDGINAIGGELTTEDTFRSYVNALNNIYDYLPKVTGTGTDVTIDGTSKGAMRITLGSRALEQRNIPSEYTEVEYITASGTQYINTNYTPVQNDEIEIKKVSFENTAVNKVVLSAGTGTYQLILLNTGSNTYYKYFASGSAIGIANLSFSNTNIKIKNNNNYGDLYINDELKAQSQYGGTVDTTLQLFRRADETSYLTGNIGEVIITNGSTTKLHLYPCYRNSDNVIGMYDAVSNKFLTNAGTGTFTKGSNATPTPSSPQDIHTISGSNTIKVFGANLLDTSTTSTVKNQTGDDRTGYYCKIPETGRYYLMLNTTNTMYYGKSTNLSSATTLIGSTTPTYTSNYDFTAGEYFIIWGTKTDSDKLMVIKSSSPVDYQPYTSQEQDIDLDTLEYCKIGNYEDKIFRTSGKNLANFPINTLPTGNTTIIDFGKDMTFDSITTSFYLNNVQYTNSSGGLINYQKNDGTNQYILPGLFRNSSNTGMNVNTTLNGQYSKTETNITFRKVIVTNYPSFTQGTLNIQVELGSSSTSFEPYGNGDWYIKKNIGKVVLDGSENWDTQNNVFTLNIDGILNQTWADRSKIIMSDYYLGVTTNYRGGLNNLEIAKTIDNSKPKQIAIRNDSYNDVVADFKASLVSNNVTCYYVLATPTYTPITGTLAEQLENVYQKMLSQKGQTNISQVNDDLSFNLSVQALEDLEV